VHEATANVLGRQRGEPKAGAATLQGGNDFGHVIANQAEARVPGVLFNDAAQGELGVVRHGVGFVENNELDARGKELLRAGEFFDFVANDLERDDS
jgi:hypothetical protein